MSFLVSLAVWKGDGTECAHLELLGKYNREEGELLLLRSEAFLRHQVLEVRVGGCF